MSDAPSEPVPVNLIAGPLGVGKTTTINHLLAQRPEGERWTVIVNEYGLVGVDAALMADVGAGGGGVRIEEVAGGCICCTAGLMFEVTLAFQLHARPDRLIIEPSGLANASGILDTLARPGFREAVDLRAVLCLLDAATLSEDLRRVEVWDQVEVADILLANRADLASSAQLDEFTRWGRGLSPPKQLLECVEGGRIALELLDCVGRREASEARAGGPSQGHRHSEDVETKLDVADRLECSEASPIVRRSHRSESASTMGWVCWEGLVFDAERAARWLGELSGQPGIRRIKAVLHTTLGWRSFNACGASQALQPAGHRQDSRVELVVLGESAPDPRELERQLRNCVLSGDRSS